MQKSDQHLIALKLILKEFDIHIVEESVNYDLIFSCFALLSIVHPFSDYEFEVVRSAGRHRVHCQSLLEQVRAIELKNFQPSFLLKETQNTLSQKTKDKIRLFKECIGKPEDAVFTDKGWLFILGLYCIATRDMDIEDVVSFIINEYRSFLPYVGKANEKVRELKFNAK